MNTAPAATASNADGPLNGSPARQEKGKAKEVKGSERKETGEVTVSPAFPGDEGTSLASSVAVRSEAL